MTINFGWLGQFFTAWGIALFIAAPLIGRYLRRRAARAELQSALGKPYIDLASEAEADKRRDQLEASLWVAKSEIERRRLSREAAIPITQSQWQDRAREAESLGFDPEIDRERAS